MNRRFLWVFLAVWGCWGGVIAEEPWFGKEIPASEGIPVRGYGDLTKLEIEGNEHFTADEIREVLADHLRLQMACRPTAELVPLIDLLQEVLEQAYRQSGFPDAKATVSPAGERTVLKATVEAGFRFTAGDIRVRGADSEIVDALRRHLTASRANDSARHGINLAGGAEELNQESSRAAQWVAGEPVRGSKFQLAKVRQALVNEMAAVGYPLAKLTVEIAPSGSKNGVADLVVDITELGARAKLDVIEIEGLERHSRDELLALLGTARK